MSAASQAPEMASALGLGCLGCQDIIADAVEATVKSVSAIKITDVLRRILFSPLVACLRGIRERRSAARLFISDGFVNRTTRGMPGRQKTGDRPQADRDTQPDQWPARLERKIQADFEHSLNEQITNSLADWPGGECGQRPAKRADRRAFYDHDKPNRRRRSANRAQHSHLAPSFQPVQTHCRRQPQTSDQG